MIQDGIICPDKVELYAPVVGLGHWNHIVLSLAWDAYNLIENGMGSQNPSINERRFWCLYMLRPDVPTKWHKDNFEDCNSCGQLVRAGEVG